MATRELIQSLADFFENEGIEYAVIGAFALYAYGYERATHDIDILTHLEHRDIIVEFLESLGFETTNNSNAFSNHLHPVGSTRVDMMYVKGKTAEEILSSRRRSIVLGEIDVPVVSPEHLIALKLFAAQRSPDRKFRELADVKEIVSRTSVDKEIVRHYFSTYGLAPYAKEILGE